MVKYTGPRLRIIRRLGFLKGLTTKTPKNRNKTPGQHGKLVFQKSKRTSLANDYKQRLIEKQKLRFNYGITESQLLSYYHQAKRQKGSTGSILLELLESRLDCLVYRLGFAKTIPSARQFINHGHFLVNGKVVTIPSFICKEGDIINVKENNKSKKLISLGLEYYDSRIKSIQRRTKKFDFLKKRLKSLFPTHLEIDKEKYQGKLLYPVKRSDVLLRINPLKVVEYYSR